MSESYPNLTATTFPDEIDTFKTYVNVSASDGALIQQYQQALADGDTTTAQSILAQISNAANKIVTADDMNKMMQAIRAIEQFMSGDYKDYIIAKQAEWQAILDEFSYEGVWNIATSYVKNNIVQYSTYDGTFLYLALSDPPVGTYPTNTTYWRLFTVKGARGASGAGLSFCGAYDTTVTYSVNDCVTYNGKLWCAIASSTNITPDSDASKWSEVMTLETTIYPVTSTTPTSQSEGELWFDTSE